MGKENTVQETEEKVEDSPIIEDMDDSPIDKEMAADVQELMKSEFDDVKPEKTSDKGEKDDGKPEESGKDKAEESDRDKEVSDEKPDEEAGDEEEEEKVLLDKEEDEESKEELKEKPPEPDRGEVDFKARYEAVLKEYSDLAGKVAGIKPVQEEVVVPEGVDKEEWARFQAFKTAPTPATEEPKVELAPIDMGKKIDDKDIIPFIADDDDYNESLKTSADFNRLLTRVQQSAVTQVLAQIPNVISYQVAYQASTRDRIDKFYRDNPELENDTCKRIVSMKSVELEQQHPDWNINRVCQELQTIMQPFVEAKKETGDPIPKEEVEKEVRRPALPGTRKQSKKPAETEPELEDEIRGMVLSGEGLQ